MYMKMKNVNININHRNTILIYIYICVNLHGGRAPHAYAFQSCFVVAGSSAQEDTLILLKPPTCSISEAVQF